MEKTFDFRTKLMKVSLAVTIAFAVAASFVMLSYAGTKTVIVDEKSGEAVIETVAKTVEPEWSLDLSYLEDEVRPIVLIDPGHGGSSYGTRAGEVAEKDIVLSIAKQIRDLCPEKPYRVVLLRENDVTVNTEERISAVMDSQADYYIGIHLSSDAEDVKAFGMKATYNPTYFRNGLENVDFADAVLMNAAVCTNNRALGVENASEEDVILQVLNIPAAVLYAGYISNADEAELLSTEEYTQKIAEGIVNALDGVVK